MNSFSQGLNDSTAIIQLLKNDYRTLETFDIQKHVDNCTTDYTLIENGEVWSLGKEIAYFKSNSHRVLTRKDFFTIHKLKIVDRFAYLIYELKSEINEKGKITTKFWSESAVFRKVDGRWKIALIHSSPIMKN